MGPWVGTKFILPAKIVLDPGGKGRKIGLWRIFVSERKCKLNLWGDQVKGKRHIEKGGLLCEGKKRVNDRYCNQDADVLRMIAHNFYRSIARLYLGG